MVLAPDSGDTEHFLEHSGDTLLDRVDGGFEANGFENRFRKGSVCRWPSGHWYVTLPWTTVESGRCQTSTSSCSTAANGDTAWSAALRMDSRPTAVWPLP